jgi:hypothetical protein
MHLMRVCGVAITIVLLAGCRTQPKPAPLPPPADEPTLTRIREAFRRIDPQSQVGPVIAALPSDRLVAIGDVPVKEFAVGETLMFIDGNQDPLVSGTIINITGDALHVRYDEPTTTRRAPTVGDLAVKVK